jgi:hypothetical protein
MARHVGVGTRVVGDHAAAVRLGAGALGVVSIRVGMARGLLGVLSRCRREDQGAVDGQGARINVHRLGSPDAPVAQVDRAAVS